MLRAALRWLFGEPRPSLADLRRELELAKQDHDAAFARKDTRGQHEAFLRMRAARSAVLAAEVSLRRTGSAATKRFGAVTREAAGGFR